MGGLTPATAAIFIVDANVLIDYVQEDAALLTLISDHLAPIHVPRRILQEVRSLKFDDQACEELGLVVVTEEYSELADAAVQSGPLSFQDYLILIMSKRRGWTPITNDGNLRRALAREGLQMRWGLEMMLDLVRGGWLTKERALRVAGAICSSNRRYKQSVLTEFRNKLAPIRELSTYCMARFDEESA